MQDFAHPIVEAREEGAPALWCWIRGELGGVVKTMADRLECLPDHVLRMQKQVLRQAADLSWDQAIALGVAALLSPR